MKVQENFFVRKKNELGVSLNEVQFEAVTETEGPLLLLASPGSGKTTTIIMRIGYLIEEKGISPKRIKAVTFSRASANDMKERFKRFFPELPPVNFSTIHSLSYEVVREYLRKTGTDFQMIEGNLDTEEQDHNTFDVQPLHKKLILRKLFKEIVGENINDDQMEELTSYISFIKNKMIPPEKWQMVKAGIPEAEQIVRDYEAFKSSGLDIRLLDYDDMLTVGNQALEEDQELLQKYQQKYEYVLTDESQDTSMIQHAIVEKLVRNHGNLCVVADDDQSIYSWRGAEPSYLLNFKKVYPNSVILFMEQNYRSTQDIVHVANQFIRRNKNRYNKNMFTQNPPNQPIKIQSFKDFVYQAKYLVQEIKKHENLAEIAVLYRNNSSSIALMNEFDRAGIPFYIKDADNRFFSHWVVEDILNFMRMVYNDRLPDLLEKIHLKMNGYISKQQIAALKKIRNHKSVFENLLKSVQLQDYQVQLLKTNRETFQQMRGMPPLHAIQVIRERLGYEKAIERFCERFGFRKEYLIGILNTLEEIADTLETMQEFANRLQHLKNVLKTAKSRKGENVVTFSTFHSSKGLEFDQVYMIDLVDGMIPSAEDLKNNALETDSESMEEATRLFYVGMTRAKKHLELISYRERDGEKASESQFVGDVRRIMNPPIVVPREAISRSVPGKRSIDNNKKAITIPFNPNAIQDPAELTVGKVVRHRVFGTGSILEVNNQELHVQFGTREKVLSISTCLEMGLLESV